MPRYRSPIAWQGHMPDSALPIAVLISLYGPISPSPRPLPEGEGEEADQEHPVRAGSVTGDQWR